MTKKQIYAPDGPIGAESGIEAPAMARLDGRRLVVLDNGKPGAAFLMSEMGRALAQRTGLEFCGVEKKGSAATPIEEDLFEAIRERADLVLTGSAD